MHSAVRRDAPSVRWREIDRRVDDHRVFSRQSTTDSSQHVYLRQPQVVSSRLELDASVLRRPDLKLLLPTTWVVRLDLQLHSPGEPQTMVSFITSGMSLAPCAASTMTALPPRAYNARPVAAMDALAELEKRASCELAENDCGNGYCCQAGHTCETQNGQHLCRLNSDTFFSPVSAERATATTSFLGAGGAAASAISSASGPPTAGSFAGSSSESSGISGGAIAGIVIGVVAVLVLLVGIMFMLRRRKRQTRDRKEAYSGALGTDQAPPQAHQRAKVAGYGEKDSYSPATVGTRDPPTMPLRSVQELDSKQSPTVAQLPGDEEMMQRKEAGEEIGIHSVQRAELDGGQGAYTSQNSAGSPTNRAELP